MSSDEFYTRLIYFGVVQLGFSIEETWLTRMGFLLDLQACHMQFNGWAKPKTDAATIDDVFPI